MTARWAALILALQVLVEALWGRGAPEQAAVLSTFLLAPALVVGGAWLVSRRLEALLPNRLSLLGWALFAWMAVATVAGWSRLYADEPLRRILLLAAAYGVGLVAGAQGDTRLGLGRYAAHLGTALAAVAAARAWLAPEPDGRWASSLESPALLGCLLCLTLPPTVAAALEGERRNRVLLLGVALQAAALVGAGSRLALGAVGVSLVWWASLSGLRSAGRRVRACVWGLLAVATVAALAVALRPSPGHESSASHRLFIWQTSARVIGREPWLGVGVGSFDTAFRVCRPWVGTDRSDTLAVVRDAHNDLLHMGAETGVAGGLLLASLLVVALARPIASRGASAGRTSVALRVGLAAWVLNGLGNGSIDVPAVAMLALAMAGALVAAGGESTSAPEATRRVGGLAVAAGVGLWGLFAVGQIGARLAEASVWAAGVVAHDRGPVALEGALETARLSGKLECYLSLAESVATTPAQRRQVLEAARVVCPYEAEVYARLALLEEDAEAGSGVRSARRAVELDAYNPYYRRQLADGLCRAGESAAAEEQYRLAEALFERTLEVAVSRNGETSPAAEAVRMELSRVRERLRDLEAVEHKTLA